MYDIDKIKLKAFDFVLGSENLDEFQYIRYLVVTMISTLETANAMNVKVKLTSLFSLFDSIPPPPDVDINLLNAYDEFKIYINDTINPEGIVK